MPDRMVCTRARTKRDRVQFVKILTTQHLKYLVKITLHRIFESVVWFPQAILNMR
jgi:hypothetical protein